MIVFGIEQCDEVSRVSQEERESVKSSFKRESRVLATPALGITRKPRFALSTPNGVQFINRPQIADAWKHNYLVSFTRTESWSDQNRLTLKTGMFTLQSTVRVHNGVERSFICCYRSVLVPIDSSI